jgi:hypothetical protein
MALFREKSEDEIAQKAERRAERHEKANARRLKLLLLSMPGLKIDGDTIRYKGEGGPIAGAKAAVESAGDINRRVSMTRLALAGPFALAMKKKKDNRELFLTVDGVGFGFVVPVDPKKQLEARQIAARINAMATGATIGDHDDAADDGDLTAPASAPGDLAAQIARLSDLHAQGVLSDDEFAAAKSKLLG